MLWGDRIAEYNGELVVKDNVNKLLCILTFNPDAQSFLSSFFVSQTTKSDTFRGSIRNSGREILKVDGSWITHINFDGERFCEFESCKKYIAMAVRNPLPSDSSFRSDLKALKIGRYYEARKQKHSLEEIQRNDCKLRISLRQKFNTTHYASDILN